jgi:methyl-accepting chemotaxis protein
MQTDQVTKAMTEQTRAIKELTDGARNISKQIGLITRSNRERATASTAILSGLADIRQIADRNATGVKDAIRGADALAERAQSLDSIMGDLSVNGRSGKKAKNKKKSRK